MAGAATKGGMQPVHAPPFGCSVAADFCAWKVAAGSASSHAKPCGTSTRVRLPSLIARRCPAASAAYARVRDCPERAHQVWIVAKRGRIRLADSLKIWLAILLLNVDAPRQAGGQRNIRCAQNGSSRDAVPAINRKRDLSRLTARNGQSRQSHQGTSDAFANRCVVCCIGHSSTSPKPRALMGSPKYWDQVPVVPRPPPRFRDRPTCVSTTKWLWFPCRTWQPELAQMRQVDAQRPQRQVQPVAEPHDVVQRHALQRQAVALPQCRQVEAVAVAARDHREAGEAAFRGLRLQHQRRAAPCAERRGGLAHARERRHGIGAHWPCPDRATLSSGSTTH